jgi:hypothetical protein
LDDHTTNLLVVHGFDDGAVADSERRLGERAELEEAAATGPDAPPVEVLGRVDERVRDARDGAEDAARQAVGHGHGQAAHRAAWSSAGGREQARGARKAVRGLLHGPGLYVGRALAQSWAKLG